MTQLRDFLQLIAKAVASGLAVGVAAAIVVLGLASTAQACDARDHLHLAAYVEHTEPRSKAPAPPPRDGGPSGVGALWAHQDSTIDILLGAMALAAVGTVTLIGRAAPAGGSR